MAELGQDRAGVLSGQRRAGERRARACARSGSGSPACARRPRSDGRRRRTCRCARPARRRGRPRSRRPGRPSSPAPRTPRASRPTSREQPRRVTWRIPSRCFHVSISSSRPASSGCVEHDGEIAGRREGERDVPVLRLEDAVRRADVGVPVRLVRARCARPPTVKIESSCICSVRMASSMLTWTSWPSPVRSRWSSAASAPSNATYAVMPSTRNCPAGCGVSPERPTD